MISAFVKMGLLNMKITGIGSNHTFFNGTSFWFKLSALVFITLFKTISKSFIAVLDDKQKNESLS